MVLTAIVGILRRSAQAGRDQWWLWNLRVVPCVMPWRRLAMQLKRRVGRGFGTTRTDHRGAMPWTVVLRQRNGNKE